MNKYGHQAIKYWRKMAPAQFDALADRDRYFDDLGKRVALAVDDLADRIAGPERSGETSKQQAARLKQSRRQAEHVVLADLVWIEPESTPGGSRQQWEASRAPDLDLADWALRARSGDAAVLTATAVEKVAADWAVPTGFILEVLAARDPAEYVRTHGYMMEISADIRFHRVGAGLGCPPMSTAVRVVLPLP
jgi:hypothetical protein